MLTAPAVDNKLMAHRVPVLTSLRQQASADYAGGGPMTCGGAHFVIPSCVIGTSVGRAARATAQGAVSSKRTWGRRTRVVANRLSRNFEEGMASGQGFASRAHMRGRRTRVVAIRLSCSSEGWGVTASIRAYFPQKPVDLNHTTSSLRAVSVAAPRPAGIVQTHTHTHTRALC